MIITNEIQTRSEELQSECHDVVKVIMSKKKPPSIAYQDATNVWLFCKIAELELKLYELSKNINHALQ